MNQSPRHFKADRNVCINLGLHGSSKSNPNRNSERLTGVVSPCRLFPLLNRVTVFPLKKKILPRV